MSEWNIGSMRRGGRFMGTVAILVVCVYAVEILSPSALALAEGVRQPAPAPAPAVNAQQSPYGAALEQIKEHLRVLSGRTDSLRRSASAEQRRASRAALRDWQSQLQGLDADTQAQFAATGRLIQDKHLPALIQQRYAQALATYRKRYAALQSDLDAISKAPDEQSATARADSAFQRLDAEHLVHSQPALDPHHLPFSGLKADPDRKPFTKRSQFIAAGLYGNPSARLASIGPFDISQFPSAQNPAYLAATTEVTLTPDIVAQASSLNGNPVAIYNWVRNNVQWQPTWGAIQSASQTLSSHKGNAFDIASLTIALLRASGIPARYVIGTINVPADQFRNWAGGFQNIDSAIQFASAGGIPITAVTTSAGQITTVQMEHVWVEAAVDFVPSRGAVNRSADTWVPMDPSFKQVQVLPGLDLLQISGIDPNQLSSSVLATGTVNQSEGWVTGFSPAPMQAAQAQAQTALQTYVQANLPNGTAADVLGGDRTLQQQPSILSFGLPYTTVVTGASYASLPSALEQQITFAFGQDVDGTPINPQTFPWAQLNNQRVTLSFVPATPADQAALNAYMPSGSLTSLSQLPASIPGYLINVIPQLQVNGTVVMTGPPTSLGQDVTFVFNPQFAGRAVQPYNYVFPAGAFLSIAVIGGSVSPANQANAVEQLQAARQAFVSRDGAGMSGVTWDTVLGNIFQSGLLAYFGTYLSFAHAIGLRQHGYYNLAAGLGSFGYEPKVSGLFGIPQSVTIGGAVMNIPIVNIIGTDSSTSAARFNYALQLGALSSTLEHTVPETLLTPGSANGVSAEKALVQAATGGQRIYEITSANMATVLPLIHFDSSTMADITNALNAGDTVITHTDPISVPGWTGEGYVILDPTTGDGAWKIAGGQNGGFLLLLGIFGVNIGLAIFLLPEAALLGVFLLAWDIVTFKQWIDGVNNSENMDQLNQNMNGAIVMGAWDIILTVLVTSGLGEAAAVILFGMFFTDMLIEAFGP